MKNLSVASLHIAYIQLVLSVNYVLCVQVICLHEDKKRELGKATGREHTRAQLCQKRRQEVETCCALHFN